MLAAFALSLLGCVPDPAKPGDTGPAPTPTGPDTDTPWTWTTPPDSGTPGPYFMAGFSFVDAHVAGLPQPGARVPLEQDLGFLVEQGVTLLVSLTETPTDPVAVEAAGLGLVHLPIVDFTPPTIDQQIALVDAIRAEIAAVGRVGVHDTAGLGRCGTMLATWFVAQGMGADEAIAEIRALRPGSIETVEQEAAVHAYFAHLQQQTP